MVGWALKALPSETTVPWWRVINGERRLTVNNPRVGADEQAERLKAEGRLVLWDGKMFLVLGEDWWPEEGVDE
jgi:alkylated DNA nucleotide flippase Atl1